MRTGVWWQGSPHPLPTLIGSSPPVSTYTQPILWSSSLCRNLSQFLWDMGTLKMHALKKYHETELKYEFSYKNIAFLNWRIDESESYGNCTEVDLSSNVSQNWTEYSWWNVCPKLTQPSLKLIRISQSPFPQRILFVCSTLQILYSTIYLTKFLIVIGLLHAYLSLNRCVITWVSNCRCPIWALCNWVSTWFSSQLHTL